MSASSYGHLICFHEFFVAPVFDKKNNCTRPFCVLPTFLTSLLLSGLLTPG